MNAVTDAVRIASRGWAWGVELTLAGEARPDPLVGAIMALVGQGYSSVTMLSKVLPGIPHDLVRGAVEAALVYGSLAGEPDGVLDAVDLDARPVRLERERGWVFWSSLEAGFIPFLRLGDSLPRRPSGLMGVEHPIGDEEVPPSRRDLQAALTDLALRDDLEFVPTDSRRAHDLRTAHLEELYLPQGSHHRRRSITLTHAVELRITSRSEADFLMRRSHFDPERSGERPIWPQGDAILRDRKDTRSIMSKIDAEWRSRQIQQRLPMLPHGYASKEKLLEEVAAQVAARVPRGELSESWPNDDFFERAEQAVLLSALTGVARTSGRDLSAALAWSSFLEQLTHQMWSEVRPIIEQPWSGAPDSRRDVDAICASLDIRLGPSLGHVQQRFSKGSEAALTDIRRKVPSAGGKGSKCALQLGCGDSLMLWLAACFVNGRGRAAHAARVRAAINHTPEIITYLNELVTWRNDTIHTARGKLPPVDDVFKDRSLKTWLALAATARA